MKAKNEILWSEHFHKRLMERFGLSLDNDHKIQIEDMIRNGEIFCVLKSDYGYANIYGAVINGHEVMIVYKVCCSSIVTAYRRSWFIKKGDIWIKKKNPKYETKKVIPNRKPKINIGEYKEKLISEYEKEVLYEVSCRVCK